MQRRPLTPAQQEQEAWDDYLATAWITAEHSTNGVMLNKAGQQAGVSAEELFYCHPKRAKKYASEELLRYWADHGRPTRAAHRAAYMATLREADGDRQLTGQDRADAAALVAAQKEVWL
jgi:hypothetical protein